MTTRTIKFPPPGGTSRTRPAVIALIGAAALVLSGLAAVVLTSGGGTARETTEPPPPAAPVALVRPSPRVAVLLVGSAEQAIDLENSAAQLSPEGLGPGVEIVVAGSADEVGRARERIQALQLKHGAANVRVVELRSDGALSLGWNESTCGTEVAQPPKITAC